MFDAAGPAPDLELLLSADDECEYIASGEWTSPTGRTEHSRFYIVLHRGHGLWTHAYRVVPDRRPGHLMIYVIRVAEGDQRTAIRSWLCGHPCLLAAGKPALSVPGDSAADRWR